MDDDAEVIAEFLIESYENLDRLVDDLLALESDPSATDSLASAFRTVHTIKGTCGFLGYGNLEVITHVGENLLSRLRDGVLTVRPEIVTALLELADVVRTILRHIESTGSDGSDDHADLVRRLGALAAVEDPAATSVPVGEALVAAGRVEPDDVALALAAQGLGDDRRLGEILVAHGATSQADVDATAFEAPGDTRAGVIENTIRVDIAVLDRMMNLVGELVLSRNNISQHVGGATDAGLVAAAQTLDVLTGELQDCVMTTRLQPISTVWSRFNRVVRDLALQCGKQVRIVTDGDDTELDKTILEAIKDPLTHIVRNSVDHGIETPDVRRAAGKPAEGTLSLRAHHEGGHVVVEISDDGAGIDPGRVLARAVEHGIVTEARADGMSRREALGLVFEPGFSTAAAVTNVSGRGVGMDVVTTNIERIGGSVEIDSTIGRGTTLRLAIPLTLAIVPALMVECAGHSFAVPQAEVQELVRIGPDEAGSTEMLHDVPVMRLRGRIIPLVDLREVLALTPDGGDVAAASTASTVGVVAVLTLDTCRWGLVVDAVRTTEEIVVKPLGPQLRGVRTFSGATILGDGHIALILDVARIARDAGIAPTGDPGDAPEDADGSDAIGMAIESTKLLVVTARGERHAIELASVDRIEQFEPASIERAGDVHVVQYRDRIVPIADLGGDHGFDLDLDLGLDRGDSPPVNAIVVDRPAGLAAVVVDEVVDVADVVIDDTARATMTVVADGRVASIIDVDTVFARADRWLTRSADTATEVFA